ncbi:MAG: hypothetical protein QM727_02335 [Niabella sp.]
MNIEFTYDKDLKVGKLSEQEYIEKRKTEAAKKDQAKAEEWEKQWKAERSTAYDRNL